MEIYFKRKLKVARANYYKAFYNYDNIVVPYPVSTIIAPPYELFVNDGEVVKNMVSVLPKTERTLILENIDCTGPADSTFLKSYNFDETPNQRFNNMPFFGPYKGCGVQYSSTAKDINSGRRIIYLEIYKNNIKKVIQDTFLVLPNQENNIHIKY